eukprot:Tbor_TRINITY_DN5488_c0_g1::TRINITY_DN5488_c0_g1_i1::g.24819::m.24819/K12948/SPCS3, SPC3; signal peptidase complex subunit 3
MKAIAAHDIITRVLFVITTTISMLAIAAGLLATSSIIIDIVTPPNPIVNFTAVSDDLYRAKSRGNNGDVAVIDRTIIYINGTFDFTSCFNWNTRLIFVMFVAEYKSKNFPRNEVTILDKTLTSVEDAKFDVLSSAKYPFDDITSGTLVGNPTVNIILKFHTMMESGWSPFRIVPPESGGVVKVDMPKVYRAGTGELYQG